MLRPGACGSNSVFDVRFTRSRARVTRVGDPALRDEGRLRGFSCSRGVSSSRPGTTDTQCGCVRRPRGAPKGPRAGPAGAGLATLTAATAGIGASVVAPRGRGVVLKAQKHGIRPPPPPATADAGGACPPLTGGSDLLTLMI